MWKSSATVFETSAIGRRIALTRAAFVCGLGESSRVDREFAQSMPDRGGELDWLPDALAARVIGQRNAAFGLGAARGASGACARKM
jgi:hypothetical protein